MPIWVTVWIVVLVVLGLTVIFTQGCESKNGRDVARVCSWIFFLLFAVGAIYGSMTHPTFGRVPSGWQQ